MSLICLLLGAALNAQDPRQAAVGDLMTQEFQRTTTPVANPDIQNYVARLGAGLSSALRFWVVNEDTGPLHEPVVIPNASIFVPVSLLTAARDESEFTGMLAQAIACSRRYSQQVGGWF